MLRDVGVRTKILCAILLIALGAVALTTCVSIVEMRRFGEHARESSLVLTDAVARESRASLLASEEAAISIERVEAALDTQADALSFAIERALARALTRLFITLALMAALVACLAIGLSRTLANPVRKLLAGVRRIGGGDLNGKVEPLGEDEIGELGEAFNAMSDDMEAYIRSYSAAEAEKERLSGELSIAAGIQNDMLPDIEPNFVGHPRLRLHAKMDAAKEVGGDFYDFFYLDEEKRRLAAVIADVSGKGIPAALFMVVAKTLLRTHLMQGVTPATALMEVNNILAEDNASNMFVTTFASILDTETGELSFANAGHNPPLLRHDGAFTFMKMRRSMPLAAVGGVRYRDESAHLDPGDALFLYTDGVTEAMSEINELFGEEPLRAILNETDPTDPARMDAAVREALREHVGRAEQSDDITTLSIVLRSRG